MNKQVSDNMDNLKSGVSIKDMGDKLLLVINREVAEKLQPKLKEWLKDSQNDDTHYALPINKVN